MTYFKPWRRKLGVVTLFLACTFTAVWIRSQIEPDYFEITIFDKMFAIATDDQCLELLAQLAPGSFDEPAPSNSAALVESQLEQSVEESTQAGNGEPTALATTAKVLIWNVRLDTVLRLPFWSLVAPLTLLSAWLLLSRPRKAESGLKPETA